MKTQLIHYGCIILCIPNYCYSESAIAISQIPIQHSKMKKIQLRYHFIKDHILKGNIELVFLPLDEEIVDVFTKTLDSSKLNGFLKVLGMINPDP